MNEGSCGIANRQIALDHPVRDLFRRLTERGMGQLNLHDTDTIQYVSNLLTEFIQIEDVPRVKDKSNGGLPYTCDMLRAAREISPSERRDYYRHIGDLTLFNLGIFPESLKYRKRSVSRDYYARQGQLSYNIVAELEASHDTALYRKLSHHFEQCVFGLNWVKVYIQDPFYQYMLREFEIT
jgi:hypothetical protein